MPTHVPTAATLIALLPLLAWRLRARYRRLIGRQRMGKHRPRILIGVSAVLLGLLVWLLWGQWPALAALCGGLCAGWLLSRWAWKRTVLEPTSQGLFYTPHTWLGVTLLLLLAARIVWRIVEIVWLLPASQAGLHAFAASPLTMAVLGLMGGHNMGYALALLLWRRRVLAAGGETEKTAGAGSQTR